MLCRLGYGLLAKLGAEPSQFNFVEKTLDLMRLLGDKLIPRMPCCEPNIHPQINPSVESNSGLERLLLED